MSWKNRISYLYGFLKYCANFFCFVSGSDYALEEEAGVYVDSVHIEGDVPVEEYSFQEYQEEQDPEAERVEEDAPLEDTNPLLQSEAETVQEPVRAIEEPVEEPPMPTYASIVCTATICSSS